MIDEVVPDLTFSSFRETGVSSILFGVEGRFLFFSVALLAGLLSDRREDLLGDIVIFFSSNFHFPDIRTFAASLSCYREMDLTAACVIV